MMWWVSYIFQLTAIAADTIQENKIMPFHKIRNHVARRGRLMNVDLDSPYVLNAKKHAPDRRTLTRKGHGLVRI